MLVKKSSLVRIGITLPLLLLVIQPLPAQTSGSATAARKGQSDGWRTRINNGPSGKRGGFFPALTPPVQASSLSP